VRSYATTPANTSDQPSKIRSIATNVPTVYAPDTGYPAADHGAKEDLGAASRNPG